MSETPNIQGEQTNQVTETNLKCTKEILKELLQETGYVSTLKLKSKLREAGHNNVDEIANSLNNEDLEWIKIDRSFYTHEKAKEIQIENDSEQSPQNFSISDNEEEYDDKEEFVNNRNPSIRSRKYKESRLCEAYIQPFLHALYSTQFRDDEVAFCVQNQRPSSQFRNVDLIAINWRDEETAELVTVEAKLEFNAQVVQQAANYSRFSHRVWIAVVVEKTIEVEQIVPSLQESDPLLFEYVLSLGLGIIACQPGRGGSYTCYPVQWPRKQDPDMFEKQHFISSYSETFEDAGLLPKSRKFGKIA